MAQLSQPLALRPATAADVLRLSELVQAAYGHYEARLGGMPRPMSDDYAEVLGRHEVTVAERGDQVVGLIVLAVTDEGLAVDNVAVDPSHQGKRRGQGPAPARGGRRAASGIRLDPPIYPRAHGREPGAVFARSATSRTTGARSAKARLLYLRKFLD